MSLRDFKKSIQKEGIPIYRDRALILRELKRLMTNGPSRFRESDRPTKIAIICVIAFVVTIFAFLIFS